MIQSLELVVTMSDRAHGEHEVGRVFWAAGHSPQRWEFVACVVGLHAAIAPPWVASRAYVRVTWPHRTDTIQAERGLSGPLEIARALWTSVVDAGDPA